MTLGSLVGIANHNARDELSAILAGGRRRKGVVETVTRRGNERGGFDTSISKVRVIRSERGQTKDICETEIQFEGFYSCLVGVGSTPELVGRQKNPNRREARRGIRAISRMLSSRSFFGSGNWSGLIFYFRCRRPNQERFRRANGSKGCRVRNFRVRFENSRVGRLFVAWDIQLAYSVHKMEPVKGGSDL